MIDCLVRTSFTVRCLNVAAPRICNTILPPKAESEVREISGQKDLLAKVGLKVTMECVRTGRRSSSRMESWRQRVSDFSGCNAETAGVNLSADTWSGEQISG